MVQFLLEPVVVAEALHLALAAAVVHQDIAEEPHHLVLVVVVPLEPSLFLLAEVHLDSHPVVLDHLALGLEGHPVAAAAAAVLVAFVGVAVVPVAVVDAAAAAVVAAVVQADFGHQQHPEVQSSLLHREVAFSSSLP
jgi:hypothetical protein